jgi:heavy metal sensor kinase
MLALRSLHLKLTLWYVLLLAVILAAFSAGIFLTLRHSLSANLNETLETRVDELLPIVRFSGGSPTLADVLPGGAEVDDQYVRVFGTSGMTYDGSGLLLVPIDREAVQDARAGITVTHTLHGRTDPFRSRFAPIQQDGEIVGVLEVGRSEQDLRETLNTLLLILGIAYPATLAIASVGGIFLAGRALSPIDRITRLARRISAEDLSQRLDVAPAGDEVGRLVRTFNDMIARLDDAFRRQRQFTADSSHELRTPLTAIKGQVEVALSRERSPGDYRQVLSGVNDEVDRLIRLVGSLLTLARADAGEIPLAREPVSVQQLAAAAVRQVQPFAREKGTELRLEAAHDVTVVADEDLLLQLLLNLLDNALKFTPPGGRVIVGWDARDGAALLRVRDSGIGIAPEDQRRIFDRFYRVDKARSRQAGGAGLGLSIARWIAEAHGGSVHVESRRGQGAEFTVMIPRGASHEAS